MRWRYHVLIVFVMVVCVFTAPAQAQDDVLLTDEELELVEYVSESVTGLLQMESIYMSGTQALDMQLNAQGVNYSQSNISEIIVWTVIEDTRPVATDITMTQHVIATDNADQNLDYSFSSNMRLVGDIVYMRFYDAPLELDGFFPDDWVVLDENSAQYSGLRSFDPDLMTNVIGATGLRTHDNAETILSIEELPEEILENGIPTRMFSVIVEAAIAFEGDEAEYLMNSLALPTFGIDFETFLADILPTITYSATMWIDTTTDLLTQIETTMNFEAELIMTDTPVNLTEEITTFYTYSRFNEAFEITAPELDD